MNPDGPTRRELIATGTIAGAALLSISPAAEARAMRHRRRQARQPHVFQTLGTELEYYRSDPPHLEARLALCKQAGYTTIQTYVPWNVHESQRGRLDFSGHTHPVIVGDHADEYQIETPDQEIQAGGYQSRVMANTNLISYIEACIRHGFKMILRPGPFISDEWRNGGLPDWLANAYPNMFMRGPHNTTLEPGFPFSPPVGSVIGGGPLFYFSGPSYADPDYIRESKRWMTSFAQAVRPYLATNHGPIIAMQVDDEICFYYRFGPFEVDYHPAMLARYGQAAPTDWPPQNQAPTALRPALEWQRFKAEQLAVWLGTLRDALRAGGADVPITHEEELQLTPPANFHVLSKAVDVLHPEFYLDPGAYTVPTIELCAAAIKAAQRQKRKVISAEMSSDDVLVRHLLAGEGMTGFLGFSYTTGIDESAVADMSTFDRTLKTAGNRITNARREADAAIIWPTEYLYAPYDSTKYGFARDVRNAIEFDIPALALLLIRAGFAFDLLDTDAAQPADYDRYPTVWLACADVLPRSTQAALVGYVKQGGHLICWPAPPTLDENYEPCTILADQLYPEKTSTFHPEDFQTISVLGTDALAYRGVQTYNLSDKAAPVAFLGNQPCGYRRRRGRGHATLLGTWPAADSVVGRIGDALEVEDLPAGAAGDQVLAALAKVWPAEVVAQVNPDPPPRAGAPTKLIVFYYANERRGGEVIAGGTAAYWDGANVACFAEIHLGSTTPVTGTSQPEVTRPPFRPITPAHVELARKLHGKPLVTDPSDLRAECRLLTDARSGAATVSVVNRYDDEISISIRVRHNGGIKRVPAHGTFTAPAGTGMLLPIAYALRPHLTVEHATVQLVSTHTYDHAASLEVSSSSGGEIALTLPDRCDRLAIDGKAQPHPKRTRLNLAVPAGAHTVEIGWRPRG